MFFHHDQSDKRRIAGYLGAVFGAACVLLAVSPGLATAAPALDKLTLTSVCTLPKGDAIFRVGNTNALAITYTWDINKTSFAGKAVATAGDSYLHVPSSSAGNTRLFVDGKQQATKAQNGKACVLHVQPVKRWVDGSGADLAAPVVPKGWKLTLDSDLETLTCTWKKAALSCTSKVDAEDKGDFTNEKPNLDVPFGGSYTITETSTSDFKQEGTGTFGPLDEPKDLDAYFAGDDTFVAVVTNHLVGEAAPSTTAEETTTTTEAPPTTLAAQDESTTTTVDEETTTTADEETTTSLVEDTTTSVVEDTTTTEAPATTLFVAATVDETTTTTVADTTTAAPSDPADDTTTTTSTTSASTTVGATAPSIDSGDSAPLDDLAVRGNDLGSGVEPASDTLPVTGAATASLAATGFLLLAAGLVIVALGRRRSVS